MRLIMGLDNPTSGWAHIAGKPFVQCATPLQTAGALLDAKAVQPGRSARNHLRAIAASNGIGKSRVNEVISMVGLDTVAKKRVKGYSLGMGQRLGIATALLGDPELVLFDEPVNGLDPEGILWIRNLMKHLASEGRTVFVSSHLMSEMAVTAEHLIVIGQGKLIADTSMDEFVAKAAKNFTRVRSPQAESFQQPLREAGGAVTLNTDGALDITGLATSEVGELAARHGVVLHELSSNTPTLEEAFMELTKDTVEYRMSSGGDAQ
jgi:ABC-2 type transport system ATP-binding protein